MQEPIPGRVLTGEKGKKIAIYVGTRKLITSSESSYALATM